MTNFKSSSLKQREYDFWVTFSQRLPFHGHVTPLDFRILGTRLEMLRDWKLVSISKMANRTVSDAKTVKGTNPQYLVEKIIRSRIYESKYWKEQCFALSGKPFECFKFVFFVLPNNVVHSSVKVIFCKIFLG